jgi:hypothetical protein
MKPPAESSPEGRSSRSASSYSVRAVDLQADRAAILELWSGHAKLPPEWKYDWFYLGSPFQTPTLLLLTHGPQVSHVGVAGLGTRRICVQGQDRTAGILADLIVEARHRTLYPAVLLQKQMQRTALLLHGIVYGFPNKNSKPIVRRLGYTKVGELIRYSRVLRHGAYLERYLPRALSALLGAVADRLIPLYFVPRSVLFGAWQVAWVESFDERFDALWQRARDFNGLIGVRDSQFLSWRFLSQPGHRYRIFTVTRRGKADIAAYAVCEADGAALHIRDFLTDPSRGDHGQLLIHLLSRAAYREGFAALSLPFLGSRAQRGMLAGAGMMERADRAEMYVHFCPENQAELHTLDWYVTCADEDE